MIAVCFDLRPSVTSYIRCSTSDDDDDVVSLDVVGVDIVVLVAVVFVVVGVSPCCLCIFRAICKLD